MKDKNYLVTGATSGIGKATAIGLAELGANVLIVCREKEKGYRSLEEIRRKSGSSNVGLVLGNLASQRSIRDLVDNIKIRYNKIHVLINIAGIYRSKRHITHEGLELTFAVNYLSRFLMTNLLMDVLKNSAPARIINIAGEYHRKGKINFEDLFGEKKYDGSIANSQSQLCNILFTYELNRRLQGSGITANCFHPGAIATDIIKNDPDFPKILGFTYKLIKPFLKKPERGAETAIYLATAKSIENISGKYFIDKNEKPSSLLSYNQDLAKKLWDVSNKLTKMSF